MLSGTVLLTGGSGFLGRAILRRAKRESWPAKFIVYSRDETKQWELKRKYPDTVCVLGDVARNVERLVAVMSGCDTVLHLAAVKYIPEAENNVLETIEVNIEGSRNVAVAAIAAGVKTVVGISTDKACAPLNLYGMTKAVMERMFGEMNRMGKTHFVTARYGNVVGSTGSVIPVFKQQLEDYKEVRVTDSRMTRFWLSVDQAIDLILWAYTDSEKYPGSTFISQCPAMTIDDIAKAVIQMNMKLNEGEHYPITYTGIRPGEKLHEALFNEQEAPRIQRDGNKGYILAPATQVGTKFPDTLSYSSDHPGHFITIEEMISLIKDAEGI